MSTMERIRRERAATKSARKSKSKRQIATVRRLRSMRKRSNYNRLY